MERYLVTGAAGFLGLHVCRALLARGERVRGVDSITDSADPELAWRRLASLEGVLDFRQVDVAEPDQVETTFAALRPTVVIHLAGLAGVRASQHAPLAYGRSNLAGFLSVLEACRQHGVGHLVYASSSSVYGAGARPPFREDAVLGEPTSVYAATKQAAELLAATYSATHGLPTTGLRLFTAYGPWGRPDMAYFRFAAAIASDAAVEVYGDGSALRDFTYVDDVVDASLAVAALPGPAAAPRQVYNVGRGEQVSVRELIAALELRLGRRAQVVSLPEQPGDLPATLADVSALRARTGFAPSIPFAEGITRFAAWLRTSSGALRPGVAPELSGGSGAGG